LISAYYKLNTETAQSLGLASMGQESALPAILAPGRELSPSRVVLERNEKIRLQPDRENTYVMASGGADATAVEPSLG
jgi:hypothetical protein